jgi:hypothetical protein
MWLDNGARTLWESSPTSLADINGVENSAICVCRVASNYT